MKRIIVLLISSLSFILVLAQDNWAPIGAEWYFDYEELLIYPYQAHGFTHYKVVKDTLVNSQNVRLIKKQVVRYNGIKENPINICLYEENLKIYMLIDTAKDFSLVYDFSLKVGDTLKVPITCDSISPIVIDSIDTVFISGYTLKRQYASHKLLRKEYNQAKVIDIFTEKIGFETSFNYSPACFIGDQFANSSLRCYHDSIIQYVNDYWFQHHRNVSCDSLINTTKIDDITYDENLKIFPNPTQNILHIMNDQIISLIEVINIQGNKITSLHFNSCNAIIDFSKYSSGIYVINIFQKNGKLFKYKISRN